VLVSPSLSLAICKGFSQQLCPLSRYNFLLDNVTKASLGVGLAFFAFGGGLTSYWVIRHVENNNKYEKIKICTRAYASVVQYRTVYNI
jgi:hypothetical protein